MTRKEILGWVLAGAALFGLSGLGMMKCTANWTGIHMTAGEESAREYAASLKLELEAVSCVKQDTDGDGYVSCTLKLADGEMKQVECAGAMNLNIGCRDPKINVRDGGFR